MKLDERDVKAVGHSRFNRKYSKWLWIGAVIWGIIAVGVVILTEGLGFWFLIPVVLGIIGFLWVLWREEKFVRALVKEWKLEE